MKKIVALVLSLVMVLGLATTAFAATTSTGSVSTTSVTPVKAALYDLAVNAGESMRQCGKDFTEIELTTVTGKIEKDVPMYVPNIYSFTYTYVAANGTETVQTDNLFIEVAKADATYALKNNGAWVYLFDITEDEVATKDTGAIDQWATAVVMDAKVPVADEDVDCGDCFKVVNGDKVPAAFYVSGDDVYYVGTTANAATATFAYMNGEFVGYTGGPVLFQEHNWKYTTTTYRGTDDKGHEIPVAVECSECEKEFAVVPAYMFDNEWVEFLDYQYYDNNRVAYLAGNYQGTVKADYFVVLKAAATTTPDAEAGDKVESAETFDAGIAMYVGMSVMAAAGSAVVLKKKD